MNLVKIAFELNKVVSGVSSVYVRFDPEILDFTDSSFSGTIFISSSKDSTVLNFNQKSLIALSGILQEAIFNKGMTLIAWNIKNFFSYVKYHTNCKFDYQGAILDLKVLENFLGSREHVAPVDYQEAISRAKVVMKDKSWDKAKRLNTSIYIPLITDVIPDLETCGMGHLANREILYSYYEIEGQINGRLCCSKSYDKCYIPHTIDDETKKNLRSSRAYDDIFLHFDFNHMEVSVLQWLSKDEKLKEILESGYDFYKVLFKLITRYDCDTDSKRSFAKSMFLPVVYGQSSRSLSNKLNIPLQTSDKIVEKLHTLFPKVFSWISNQKVDSDGYCYDFFGRRRFFDEDSFYKSRNFVVQSPASFICLEKLIALHKVVEGYGKVACNIHDGYVIITNNSIASSVKLLATKALEESSSLCAGLELKVNCKAGSSLCDLK